MDMEEAAQHGIFPAEAPADTELLHRVTRGRRENSVGEAVVEILGAEDRMNEQDDENTPATIDETEVEEIFRSLDLSPAFTSSDTFTAFALCWTPPLSRGRTCPSQGGGRMRKLLIFASAAHGYCG